MDPGEKKDENILTTLISTELTVIDYFGETEFQDLKEKREMISIKSF